MTAFLISRISPRDPKKMAEYAKAAGQTLEVFGARPLLRGKAVKTLLGAEDGRATGVIEFPDMASLNAWFASPAYQDLAELRDAAGDMQFIAYEVPVA